MALIKLAKKYGADFARPMKDKKVYYPSLTINAPTDLKVGETVEASVKLKLKRAAKNDDDMGSKYSCDYDILSIDLPDSDDTQESINFEKRRRKS